MRSHFEWSCAERWFRFSASLSLSIHHDLSTIRGFTFPHKLCSLYANEKWQANWGFGRQKVINIYQYSSWKLCKLYESILKKRKTIGLQNNFITMMKIYEITKAYVSKFIWSKLLFLLSVAGHTRYKNMLISSYRIREQFSAMIPRKNRRERTTFNRQQLEVFV